MIDCRKMKEMSVWTTGNVQYFDGLDHVLVIHQAFLEFGSRIPILNELDLCDQIHFIMHFTLNNEKY